MLTNTYSKKVGIGKVIFENLRYHFKRIKNYFSNGLKHHTVLFYPDMPSKKSVAYKLVSEIKYNITNNPKVKHQLAVSWEDKTYKGDFKDQLNTENKINFGCLDISKIKVDSVFNHVFHYSTFVDPATHSGKLVQKSDVNAKHDGKILDGPLKAIDKDFVYQLVIDNTEGDLVMDLRTPVFNGTIPFVYKKYRPQTERFSNTNSRAEMVETASVYSPEEIDLIHKFCMAMQLNYGELDILRDKASGKIFIIDVNTTPWGPPNHLKKEEINKAIDILSKAFKNTFLS